VRPAEKKQRVVANEFASLLGSKGAETLKALRELDVRAFDRELVLPEIVTALADDLDTTKAINLLRRKSLYARYAASDRDETFLKRVFASQFILGFDLRSSPLAEDKARDFDELHGAVLLLAVLAGSLSPDSILNEQLRGMRIWLSALRQKLLVKNREKIDRRMSFGQAKDGVAVPTFLQQHGGTMRHALPAWVCLLVVLILTQAILGNVFTAFGYWDALLVLSSFLAILALGQGAVILTGGLDLSVPWMIALSGIVLTGTIQGGETSLLIALPLVFGIAVFVGLLNGLGIVVLGLSPIVVTLAMNGILQGVALLYSNGTPAGFAPDSLRWMMTGELLGVTPIIFFMILFAVTATLLLGRTAFGRRVYAIGNSEEAARLSGVRTGRTLILIYILCAVCSALVGVLLTGFSGQASLGMGDEYLLPSIAIVVVGGALITGGRGHYLGMLGGALLLTAMQTLLAGTTLPYAFRAVFFGLVILVAVIGLREKKG